MKFIHKVASKLPNFIASDGCVITEAIHPNNDSTIPGISIARAILPPAKSTKPHRLEFVEVYYLISGQGIMHLDDERFEVGPDSCVYIPSGVVQWLENPSPDVEIVFLCVCHPAYDPQKDHPASLDGGFSIQPNESEG
jgi:mannose-6-phosphate isomerase-like protein (cupin superfamily)